MIDNPHGPAFVAYAIAALVLSLNLIFLWAYSGAKRAGTKVAINPEDAAQYGVSLAELDPPAVARVLRAHANAQAMIYPFLFLGLIFVLAGGNVLTALIVFAVFTLARLCHSAAYLAGKQPWRTVSFAVSGVALLALMIALVWTLVAPPSGG
jgi:microsomal prostaglandin-E synthase 1